MHSHHVAGYEQTWSDVRAMLSLHSVQAGICLQPGVAQGKPLTAPPLAAAHVA